MAVSIDIIGTEEGNCGKSCHIHSYCGQVLDVGSVVCIKFERNFSRGFFFQRLLVTGFMRVLPSAKLESSLTIWLRMQQTMQVFFYKLQRFVRQWSWCVEGWKSKNWGYCNAKITRKTSETMEFRSETDQLIDHAKQFHGREKDNKKWRRGWRKSLPSNNLLKNTRDWCFLMDISEK